MLKVFGEYCRSVASGWRAVVAVVFLAVNVLTRVAGPFSTQSDLGAGYVGRLQQIVLGVLNLPSGLWLTLFAALLLWAQFRVFYEVWTDRARLQETMRTMEAGRPRLVVGTLVDRRPVAPRPPNGDEKVWRADGTVQDRIAAKA